MELINCTWELANLDCRVAELSVQSYDDFNPSMLDKAEKDFDYLVVKADSKDFRLYEALGRLGYQFVEAQFSVQKNIRKFDVSSDKLVQYHLRYFQLEPVVSLDTLNEALLSMTPDMYSTDRIYLDPCFGPGYSLRRYRNWSMTEFQNGSPCFRMMYCGKCAGLAVLKKEGEVLYGLLAGFYEEYQKMGLGILIPTLPLVLKDSQCWLYKTNISSNNLPVIQMYFHHNYNITKIRYVFTKHTNYGS